MNMEHDFRKIETKVGKNILVKPLTLKNKLGFNGPFVVDVVGRSGGFALFWNGDICFSIQNYSRRHINAEIQLKRQNTKWKWNICLTKKVTIQENAATNEKK
jgi:hypothetical protein